jgi:DNA-binding FrmR family transcriptional regulator
LFICHDIHFQIAAIFNTAEGANDLSRRLDEFIKNRQAMAKPVQMEKLFEQLKNVMRKVGC